MQTEGVPVDQIAVFDGFHAWKHATRFGFNLVGTETDDLAGLTALTDDLAPDLTPVVEGVTVVDADSLKRRCVSLGLRTVHHTRIVAWGVVPKVNTTLFLPEARTAISTVPSVLVDGARHPGNLGAVVRVCAAAGSPAVFSYGLLDPWHPDVVRGGAGLHAAVPVIGMETLSLLSGPLFALDADGEDIGSFHFPAGAVLAVGAERDGVSDEVRQRADGVVSLPMRAGVSSMNLATSVSAALYVHVSMTDQPSKPTGRLL
jgi:RNA methyltransferase, TrmH family